MRVSESMKQNAAINNMRQNASEGERLSQNISTGKRVLNPSDDPVSYVKGEEKLRNLTLNQSTQNGIYTQRGELDMIDYTLEEVGSLIQEAKVLTLKAANAHFDDTAYMGTATQIDKMLERLVELANTKIGKVYLFSGTKSLTAPITLNKSGKIADVFHPGDVWRSTLPIQSGENDTTFYSGEAAFQLSFIDDQKKEHQLNTMLYGVMSAGNLAEQLNNDFADYAEQQLNQGNILPDKYLNAQIGADGKIYIDSAENFKIRSVETDVFTNFGTNFEKTTDKDWVKYAGSDPKMKATFNSMYGEKLIGNVPEEFTVKIISPGQFDEAEYIVLNSRRETISGPNKLNGIINAPIGENDNEADWKLTFRDDYSEPYFKEGLEFRFYPSEFAQYQGNDEIREIPLDDGKRLAVTQTANNMFFKLNGKSSNTFDLLKNVRDAMESARQDLVAAYIDDFDTALNQVLKTRANAGSTYIEVERSESRIKESDLLNKEEYSELIDQDFPEAATDLKMNQLKSDATYQVTSELVQPGLINFLK